MVRSPSCAPGISQRVPEQSFPNGPPGTRRLSHPIPEHRHLCSRTFASLLTAVGSLPLEMDARAAVVIFDGPFNNAGWSASKRPDAAQGRGSATCVCQRNALRSHSCGRRQVTSPPHRHSTAISPAAPAETPGGLLADQSTPPRPAAPAETPGGLPEHPSHPARLVATDGRRDGRDSSLRDKLLSILNETDVLERSG